MLVARVATRSLTCRAYSASTRSTPRSVPILQDASLATFRDEAFVPATPVMLPKGTFRELPAISKWFEESKGRITLHKDYLSRFGATIVPLEITHDNQFSRIEQSFSFFLECIEASTSTKTFVKPSRYFSAYFPHARAVKRTEKNNTFFNPSAPTTPSPEAPRPTRSRARVYLAQAPIVDLPQALQNDVPIPEFVSKAGKGDVYDSSIWLGQAPTYTPLHRDPNPNLFVQLAGTKVVRLCSPEIGAGIFHRVQEKIGGSASASLRGEEMMQGREREVLESAVWGDDSGADEWNGRILEARLEGGDGLFIPKGWWHSVKGTGRGMTGSVNWWFR